MRPRQERAVAWRVLVSEGVTAASMALREEERLIPELQKRLAKPGIEEGRWFLTDQISKQGQSPATLDPLGPGWLVHPPPPWGPRAGGMLDAA